METTPPSSPNRAPAPAGPRSSPRNGRGDGDALLPLPAPPAVPAVPGRTAVHRGRRAWPGWERLSRLVLAFAIASLLWVYVQNTENPISTRTFASVPMGVRGLAPNLSLSAPPDNARVDVQAPQDVLQHLSASDFSPTIDLTDQGPGSYDVPVHITTPRDTFDVTVTPSQVHVEVIAVQVQTATVQVRTQGTVALGYETQTPQVRPPSVTVRGQPDQLARIDQVVAYVDVTGRQSTQQVDVPVHALDSNGQEISGLNFDPSTVTAVIPIQQLLNFKTVPIRPRLEGSPGAGYRVTDIVVQPTTFTVFGSPSTLESLNFLETRVVSVRGAMETVTATVPVSLPQGITLYPPDTPNQVQVQVAIEELTTRTTLSVLVQKTGLAPGLISIESPDRVDVTLNGPFDALQDVKPDSIKATVDLTGLGVGTYKLQPTIEVPARTTQQAVVPTTVTVTITGPPTATPPPNATTTPGAAPAPGSVPYGPGEPPVGLTPHAIRPRAPGE